MSTAGAPRLARYEYAVIHAVPRADRGETVNLGVLLYCRERQFLAAAGELDENRLRMLYPEIDIAGIRTQLAVLAGVCLRAANLTWDNRAGEQGKAFAWLTAPRSTVLRPGPVHSGFTADPPAELRRLCQALTQPC